MNYFTVEAELQQMGLNGRIEFEGEINMGGKY